VVERDIASEGLLASGDELSRKDTSVFPIALDVGQKCGRSIHAEFVLPERIRLGERIKPNVEGNYSNN
jgi:hypothetical protein